MTRRTIKSLPPGVVSKIAAGEVVERPASVVKELLENALDAGARRVTIEVVEGGRDLIRVVDDGHGIPAAELSLAVADHATSKIDSADELFSVGSFGFRGEALNSIAGVSELSVASRPADQGQGAAIRVEHGQPAPVVARGCPEGTQIEVKNLFASVPVRRKFLKNRQTEFGHIAEAVIRVALAHPGVELRLIHNDRVVYERPADADLRSTISLFFGREVAEALYPVDSGPGRARVHGLVADPRIDRPNSQYQYLFVNGRFIRDRSLSHAISEAYRGLLMTGRYPVAFLFLEIPPEDVDVNVHPTKIEVRFVDPHRLYSLILSAIRTKFLASDLTASLAPVRGGASGDASDAPKADAARPNGVSQGTWDTRAAINREFNFTSGAPVALREGPAAPTAAPTTPLDAAEGPALDDRRPFPMASADAPPLAARASGAAANPSFAPGLPSPRPLMTPANGSSSNTAAPSSAESVDFQASPPRPPALRAMQLHHSYLVAETPEGMLLVDQHALHERILFEELKERVARQAVEAQELLVPEPVELSPTEAGMVLDHADVLASLGLRVGEFGDRCVLVHSYPALLRRLAPEDLIRDVARHLAETGKPPSREQLLEELLHMMACKGAIKAGDPLTPEEIDDLLSQRAAIDDGHHCPHGRPTILRFTLRDLERQFKRI